MPLNGSTAYTPLWKRLETLGGKFRGSTRIPKSNMSRFLLGPCSTRNAWRGNLMVSCPGRIGCTSTEARATVTLATLNALTSTVALEGGIANLLATHRKTKNARNSKHDIFGCQRSNERVDWGFIFRAIRLTVGQPFGPMWVRSSGPALAKERESNETAPDSQLTQLSSSKMFRRQAPCHTASGKPVGCDKFKTSKVESLKLQQAVLTPRSPDHHHGNQTQFFYFAGRVGRKYHGVVTTHVDEII